ncbi:methyltransferase domain-containing protein [Myroides sp. JBRI-B21084]|uniref:class I SAM-dependent methyltransferase n=1 Tax=Myroides sp. JBRI-B21084 TaxID=3119977 RepID=UPI0026E48E43|nr:methyltransferase domain-containing protein [Paenimyroides cloacae]WKW47228.1 methyltransferase domain-containing protein [Paenimyroides cloacae]
MFKDLFGKAMLDYIQNNQPENLITETNISEADEMDVAYLFRSYKEMPNLEQKALKLAKGNILDVGCGAGSHALYLQEIGLNVTAIDVSANAIETCKIRGVNNAIKTDILEIDSTLKYDTILLLMNGTGIFGRLKNIDQYLTKLKDLLTEKGQILIDSSDLIYMFDEDEDGGKWIPLYHDYYGELIFNISYKGEKEEPFNWLYLDFNTLQNACLAQNLKCELILEGENFDYLARITK